MSIVLVFVPSFMFTSISSSAGTLTKGDISGHKGFPNSLGLDSSELLGSTLEELSKVISLNVNSYSTLGPDPPRIFVFLLYR